MLPRSRKRAAGAVAACVAALNCLACAGVAFPPMRASTTGGPAVGTASTTFRYPDGTPDTTRTASPAVNAAIETRVGFYPLAVPESMHERRWDIGGGYAYTQFYGPRPNGAQPVAAYHGVFVTGAWYPWISTHRATGFGRWGLHLDLNVPLGDDALAGRVGVGGTVATTIEWVDFANGSVHATEGLGGVGAVAYGEGAIGLRLAMSAYDVDGQSAWMATAGISVTIPALALGVYEVALIPDHFSGSVR